MKLILFGIIMIFSLNTISQGEYFSHTQANNWNGSIHSQVELVGDDIITLGLYQSTNDLGHYLQSFNSQGILQADLGLFSGDAITSYSNAFLTRSDYFYFSGLKVLEGANAFSPYGVKYTSNGEIALEYSIPNYLEDSLWSAQYTACEVINSGEVLFAGGKVYDVDNDPFPDFGTIWLVKNGVNGNVLWENELEIGEGLVSVINGIFELNNGDILLSGAVYTDWNQILVRLDSNGNHLWTYEWGEELDDWLPWVVQEENNKFTIAYQEAQSIHNNNPIWMTSTIHVMKFDADTQEVLWDVEYEELMDRTFMFDFIKTSDGGYAIMGLRRYLENGYRNAPYIRKIDSSGNTEWYKEYVNSNYPDFTSNFLHDIEQTSDCGYVLAGETYGGEEQPQSSWLLKIDQCGDIEFSGCMPCVDSVSEFDVGGLRFDVYPNPTQDLLTLELDQITFGQQLNASLRNTLGQEIFTQDIYAAYSELDVSKLPSGVYVLSLVSDGRELSSKRIIIE